MNKLREETLELIKMLPEDELLRANNFIKNLIKEWDPDFTKYTKEEYDRIQKSEKEVLSGEYFQENDIFSK